MATDQMPPKAIGQTQGWLQIDRSTPRGFGTQGGALERLFAHISEKPITHTRGNGQTDPVHRHAVPQLKRGERSTATHQ